MYKPVDNGADNRNVLYQHHLENGSSTVFSPATSGGQQIIWITKSAAFYHISIFEASFHYDWVISDLFNNDESAATNSVFYAETNFCVAYSRIPKE